MPSTAARPRSRSCRPAPRTCSRPTSRYPKDIEQAVAIGLRGPRRKLDVGRMNGERFAVMAGAGFDAQMIRAADAGLKDRIGRVAYVWTGMKELGRKPFEASVKVDGSTWFEGRALERPARERRRALRRRRGVRGREARRRPARARRGDRRRPPRVDSDDRTDRRRRVEHVPVRSRDEGEDRRPSRSIGRSCTSSTAATARRSRSSRSRSSPPRSRCAFRGTAHEHGHQGSRDLGADGRRRAQDAPRNRVACSCSRTRSSGCGWRTASATLARSRS